MPTVLTDPMRLLSLVDPSAAFGGPGSGGTSGSSGDSGATGGGQPIVDPPDPCGWSGVISDPILASMEPGWMLRSPVEYLSSFPFYVDDPVKTLLAWNDIWIYALRDAINTLKSNMTGWSAAAATAAARAAIMGDLRAAWRWISPFKDGFLFGVSRYAGRAGIFNRGRFRIGWSWNKALWKYLFAIKGGTPTTGGHRHFYLKYFWWGQPERYASNNAIMPRRIPIGVGLIATIAEGLTGVRRVLVRRRSAGIMGPG
jgi:hypothetical protein